MKGISQIQNRAFTFDPAGKIEVFRTGEYPHPSGIIQVVDGLALEKIIANFQRDSGQTNFPGLLVDFDHFSSDLDKPSEAAGWITGLEHNGNQLLATVDWTGAGEEAVSSGRYRLLSPVFESADMEDLGDNRKRPIRLDGAGLTNSPNMKGLAPISNRGAAVNIETLSPGEAGKQFSSEVAQIKNRQGCTFQDAWNFARTEFSALYNRMALATEAPRQTHAAKQEEAFVKFACDALYALADEERNAANCSFADAWQRVRNRRRDLSRLSNREASPAMWEVLSEQAFEKFASGIKLGPDGRRIVIVPDLNNAGKPNKNSSRKLFSNSYDSFSMREPQLNPREVWEIVKTEHLNIFWPFVAMTAQ